MALIALICSFVLLQTHTTMDKSTHFFGQSVFGQLISLIDLPTLPHDCIVWLIYKNIYPFNNCKAYKLNEKGT